MRLGLRFLIPLLCSFSMGATTLEQRFEALSIAPSDLFHEPRNAFEEKLLEVGRAHWWKRYAKGVGDDSYQGYILRNDPYLPAMGRISFLLGSDCSNFVNRLYQLLGAPYQFGRTRHFVALRDFLLQQEKTSSLSATEFYRSKAREGRVIDLPIEWWLSFTSQFELKLDHSAARVGDILLWEKRDGILGGTGHMGVLSSTKPWRVLHSRPKAGIVEEAYPPPNVEGFEPSVFRYTIKVREDLLGLSIEELLERDWRR